MADREVKVKLSADVNSFAAAMATAAGSAKQLQQNLTSSRAAAQSLAGMAKNTLAGAFAVAGNAVNLTAVGLATMATKSINAGVAFNRLQQRSGTALKTLMGSTEAAQKQLADLNAFADNSPFGRDTFLQAQQTLLGFGLEAQNVVPYLSAIQDAVAGIGGTNQDITEITQVIAKIRSSATLGQQDLLELGNRGINAAALIAEATGKTEQEVRASIFGNPLRGEAALAGLDAMMQGMQKRFQGAAAGLKNTFEGAQDRVKAAMRDIGAVISAPIIDPKGGGWGVTLTNSYADVLRGVQAAITPMVEELALRMGPAMVDINQKLQNAARSIRGLTMNDLRAWLAGIQPMLPAVAGGLAAMSAQGLNSIPILAQLGIRLNPVSAGLAAVALASPTVRAGIADVAGAFRPLIPVAVQVGKILGTTLTSGLSILGNILSTIAPGIQAITSLVAAIPAPMLATVAAVAAAATAFRKFQAATVLLKSGQQVTGFFGAFTAATQLASNGLRNTTSTLTGMVSNMRQAHQAGLSPMSAALAGIAPVAAGAKAGIAGIGTALKAAFVANPIGLIIMGVTTALGAFALASADAKQKAAEYQQSVQTMRGTLDATTHAITEQTRVQVEQNLAAEGWTDRAGELINGTGNMAQMVSAASGENRQMITTLTQLTAAQGDWSRKIMSTSGDYYTYEQALKKVGVSQEEFIRALALGGEELEKLKVKFLKADFGNTDIFTKLKRDFQGINFEALQGIYLEAQKIEASRELARQAAEETRRLAEAGGEAAITQRELAAALAVTSDTSADVQQRLRAVYDVLDLLNGGTRTQAEQQYALQESIKSLGETFDTAADGAGSLSDAIVDQAGTINMATEQGRAFYAGLKDVNDEMIQAGIAAANQAERMGEDPYTAALEAMRPYRQELDALGQQLGLTPAQLDAIAQQVGMLPEDVAMVLTLDDQASQQLLGVQLALQNLGEGETSVTISALTDEAKSQLTGLGFQLKDLGNGYTEISVSADPSRAKQQIDSLGLLLEGTTGQVKIDADTSEVDKQMDGVVMLAGETTGTVQLDADPRLARTVTNDWALEAQSIRPPEPRLSANPALARAETARWSGWAAGQFPVARLGANRGPATSTVYSWVGLANRTTGTVTVNARDNDTHVIQGIGSQLRGLMDRTVTVYTRNVQTKAGGGEILGYAYGGSVTGGIPGRDSVPALLMPGEHVLTKRDVEAMGGQAAVYAFRAALHQGLQYYADGGDVRIRQAQRATTSVTNTTIHSGIQPGATLTLDIDGRTVTGVIRQHARQVAADTVRGYDAAGAMVARHGRQKGR